MTQDAAMEDNPRFMLQFRQPQLFAQTVAPTTPAREPDSLVERWKEG